MHYLFDSCIPLLYKENDDDTMEALRKVLVYIGDERRIQAVEEEEKRKSEEEARQANENDTTAASVDINVDKNNAAEWIAKLSDPENDIDTAFKAEMESTMQLTVKCWIIALVSGTNYKNATSSAAKKKIEKWLSVPHLRRPYQMKTREALSKIAGDMLGTAVPRSMKKDKIIDLILNPPNLSENVQMIVDPDLAPIVALLDKSFLCLQADRVEHNAAFVCHQNEEPFLKAFWDYCIDQNDAGEINEFTKLTPVAAYRPGLVKKKEINS